LQKTSVMETQDFPVIEGVAIPIDFDRFIPPDLEYAFDYYPSYLRCGGTWAIRPYLCDIVRQFAHYEANNGRLEEWGGFEQVKDKSLQQFFTHVGFDRALQMMQSADELFYDSRLIDNSSWDSL